MPMVYGNKVLAIVFVLECILVVAGGVYIGECLFKRYSYKWLKGLCAVLAVGILFCSDLIEAEKSKELQQIGWQVGYDAGFDEGHSAGELDGYDSGSEEALAFDRDEMYNDGYWGGFDEGYGRAFSLYKTENTEAVYQKGYAEGHDAGYDEGFNDGKE